MSALPTDIVIIPRWAGTPGSDWYPAVQAALAGQARVRIGEMPNPAIPHVERWPQAVADLVERPADTVLVGHSVGCQAVLRYLATREPGQSVRATLCVAGWWSVDRPWDTILPWMRIDYPLDRTRAAAGTLSLLISDNDPFTADFQANAELWRERLGAEVHVYAGGKHFNAAQEPAVERELRRLAGLP